MRRLGTGHQASISGAHWGALSHASRQGVSGYGFSTESPSHHLWMLHRGPFLG